MKFLFNRYALLAFLVLLCMPIGAQKVLDMKDIISSAPILRGRYIPEDINDAMRVLDTIGNGEMGRHLYYYNNKAYLITEPFYYIELANTWCFPWDSRIKRNLQSKYSKKAFGFSETATGIILELYQEKLFDKNFDPDSHLKERFKGRGVSNTPYYQELSRSWRRGLFKKGIIVGRKVYYQYPFGCTSQEEADYIKQYIKDDFIIYSEKDKFPTGVIEKVDQKRGMVLIRITKTIDERGIIIFDGTIAWKSKRVTPFYNKNSDVIFLKKGDKIWYSAYDLYNKNFWSAKK